MTGNSIVDCGLRIADSSTAECGLRIGESSPPAFRQSVSLPEIRNPQSALRNQKGFSLLELMIAMFIMIILLSVALPTYQRTVMHAKETVLKENLWQIRKAIDGYASDKGRLPETLDQLVEGKYLREMPIDPVLEKAEWDSVMGEDSLSPDGEQGLKDVKSLAEGTDSEGKAYKEY